MKNIFFTIITLTAIVVLNSCEKQLSKEDILSSHKWIYYEIIFNDKKTDAEAMGYPMVSFRKNKTYKLEYGPMADSGTWKIQNDSLFSTISEVSNNQSQSLKILMLTKDTFRVHSVIDSNKLTLTMVPYTGREMESKEIDD